MEEKNKPPPKYKSQAQLLLELTAISGEYPAENISKIIPAKSYAKKVISSLISDKQIKLVSRGKLRGYRLEIKAKRKLLAENPDRFADYLEGAVDTNKLRTDHTRRLRLHSSAKVYTLMHTVGVRIFKDTKPAIYPARASPSQTKLGITAPCFYSSREQKDENAQAMRGSQAIGTLLTPTHVFAVYNTRNSQSDWRGMVEMRYRAIVQDDICKRLPQYSNVHMGGIMLADSLDALENFFTPQAKTEAAHNFAAKTYQPFYFITHDTNGEAQLRILCDNSKIHSLEAAMQKGLKPADGKFPIVHDALTEDGNPVLFCCLPNIPRLVQFRNGTLLHDKCGMVIAFDFQREVLSRYLGDGVDFKPLSLDKVMERLFPEERA